MSVSFPQNSRAPTVPDMQPRREERDPKKDERERRQDDDDIVYAISAPTISFPRILPQL
jgi:hypothetical protein